MRSIRRTVLSMALAVAMMLCALEICVPALAFAADSSVTTLIVELTEDCVFRQQKQSGAAVNGAQAARRLRTVQTQMKNKIKQEVRADLSASYAYSYVLNGFSIRASAADIQKIRSIPGVKNVYVSETHSRRTENASEPASETASEAVGVEPSSVYTQIDAMHAAGYKGEGMLIAVVDSEFDLGHSFLTAPLDDPAGARYASASALQAVMDKQQLNADVRATRAWRGSKVPFAWNYDTGSVDTYSDNEEDIHGSHVAGIAAGKNGTLESGELFNGVAPEAQLLLLASVSLEDAACIAAIDDAAALGADVVNMSWGTDYVETPVYDTVFQNALDGGMIPVEAAGNAGRMWYPPELTDYGSMGTPGLGTQEFNVASACCSLYFGELLTLTVNNKTVSGYDQTEFPFAGLGTVAFVPCFSEAGPLPDVENAVAVFPFYADLTRVQQALDNGAAGLLLLDPDIKNETTLSDEEYDWYLAFIELAGEVSVPVCVADAQKTALFETAGTLTAESNLVYSDLPAVISEFSAWGVGTNLELDPDITAPGEFIWSSVPEAYAEEGYAYFDGTSMAAPHITGATALVKQYLLENEAGFSSLSPAAQAGEIRTRMQSAAEVLWQPEETEGGETAGVSEFPYSPRVQGAGLLQVLNAATTPVYLEGTAGKGEISLGEIGNTFTVSFTAKNPSDRPAAYDEVSIILFTDAGEPVGDGYAPNTMLKSETKGLPDKVTVPAGGETTVSFTVTLDEEQVKKLHETYVNGFFADGFVFLSQSQGIDPDLSIPFMGFVGDWSASPLLDGNWWDEESFFGLSRLVCTDDDVLNCGQYSDFFSGLYDIDADPLGINPYDFLMPYPTYDDEDLLLPDDFQTNRLRDEDDGTEDDWEDEEVIDYSACLVGFDAEADYNREEFGGISPNGDDCNDYLRVSLVPLRMAEEATVTVFTADGEPLDDPEYYTWYNVVSENVTGYDEKIPLEKLTTNVLQLMEGFDGVPEDRAYESGQWQAFLPEGEYTLQVEAKFRADSERAEARFFPFYVDVTEPEIVRADIVKEGNKTFLEVEAKDNFHLAAIGITDPLTGWFQQLYPVAGSKKAVWRFNVSDILFTDGVSVYAEDYVGNYTEIPLDNGARFLGGFNHTWSRDLGDTAAFRMQGRKPDGDLVAVFVNGEALEEDMFHRTGASLFVYPAALENAPAGDCEIAFAFEDGSWLTCMIRISDAPCKRGDADFNDQISAADARLALRVSVGLEPVANNGLSYAVCDITGDGLVKAEDARLILRAAVGLEDPDTWAAPNKG